MEGKLEILAWNCRSLLSKLSYFKVRLYCLKPHVVCLSETWLRANREPNFINYRSFFKHRQDQAGGSICILVRSDVSVITHDLRMFIGGKLEIQSIAVVAGKKYITLVNLYNPCNDVSEQEFYFYFE